MLRIRGRDGDAGFSLIELLIVIIVLGVLAAVVIFSVRGITDNGQDSACAQDSRIIATAVEAYFAQETTGGSIPATGTGLDRYEQTLLVAGLIREPSEYWNVAAEGYLISVTPC